jgi:indolepyruvate decarboxylase
MTTVSDYLAGRLRDLGADHLFFIPGNYSAEFLLAAEQARIKCIGVTNELEAGYAADAYSRYRGIGVCCVTYGVGTQSLYNAIAGAFVEYCPVVLVNGSPPTIKVEALRIRGILFAHAIDVLRTDKRIFEPVTVASAVITEPFTAPRQIDSVLLECVRQKRPVYLEVHQGAWSESCEPAKSPLALPAPSPDEETEWTIATNAAADAVLALIKKAEHPVLWGGEMLARWGVAGTFRDLVKKSKLSYTTTLMGKGLIPETDFPDQFLGVYDSKFVQGKVKEVVEQSDLLVALGTIPSEFYADIVAASYDHMILAAGDAVRVARALYPNVPLDRFVRRLTEQWKPASLRFGAHPGAAALVADREARSQAARSLAAVAQPLTWKSFFARLRTFLTTEMIVLTDTSLAFFPSAELPISRQAGYLAQTAWLSIGYTNGATLGVAEAVPDARPVALVGDGGFQMIPQAFSTLVRQHRPAVLFVLDNGLYGIEQYLVDQQFLPPEKQYFRNSLPEPSFFNALPKWDYVQLAEAFGGKGFAVGTDAELNDVLENQLPRLKDVPALVAVRLDPHDLPPTIAATVQRARAALAAMERAEPPATVVLDAFN